VGTHRSPRTGSVWIETRRRGTLVAVGRQTERGKPTVRASVTVQRGLVGRQHARAVADAVARCRAILAQRVAERDAAGAPPPATRERLTLAAYAALWLAAAQHSERRPSTVAVYRRMLDRHVLPVLGAVQLRDLRREHVVRWWATVPTDALRAQAHAVLRQVLAAAAADGHAVAAPLLRADRPRYAPAEQPHVSTAQMRRLLAASAEPWRTLFLLAWTTGARVGELLGFVWADLDEVGGTLALTHQLGRAEGGRVDLKARRQRRRVALGPATLAALRAHRAREARAGRGQPGDFMFCRAAGLPLYYRLVRAAFKGAAVAAGLPAGLKLHSLRHGAAQAMLDAGVDLDTVSRRLGHADVATTSGTYLRRSAEADADAARRLEAALGPTGAAVAPTVAPTGGRG
jgi:integrase